MPLIFLRKIWLVNLVADFLLEGNKSKKQYKQKEHHDANYVVKPIFQVRRIRQTERKKKKKWLCYSTVLGCHKSDKRQEAMSLFC